MNKIYFIQFDYAGETHYVAFFSYADHSKGTLSDETQMVMVIESYLTLRKLRKEVGLVKNACLFGDDEKLILKVSDFSNL